MQPRRRRGRSNTIGAVSLEQFRGGRENSPKLLADVLRTEALKKELSFSDALECLVAAHKRKEDEVMTLNHEINELRLQIPKFQVQSSEFRSPRSPVRKPLAVACLLDAAAREEAEQKQLKIDIQLYNAPDRVEAQVRKPSDIPGQIVEDKLRNQASHTANKCPEVPGEYPCSPQGNSQAEQNEKAHASLEELRGSPQVHFESEKSTGSPHVHFGKEAKTFESEKSTDSPHVRFQREVSEDDSPTICGDQRSPGQRSQATKSSSDSRPARKPLPEWDHKFYESKLSLAKRRSLTKEQNVSFNDSQEGKAPKSMNDEDDELLMFGSSWCGKHLIIKPSHPLRIGWDIMGVALLMYDMICIPLSMFDPPAHPITTFMDWFTLCFWTCDVLASLTTGYIDDGVTIMEPKKILRNYLSSWFILDCAVVVPDWTFTIIELGSKNETGEGGNIGKLLRAARAVRIVRILRLAKLQRVVWMIRDRIDSEYMFVVVSIVRLVLFLVAINHYIGCTYYGLSTLAKSNDMENWIDEYRISDRDFGYRYATTLHWSLTQFTPGSMSIQPMNIIERTYCVCVLVIGLVIFSFFVSNITASMTQLRTMKGEISRQFWLLRRFLRQHSVPLELSFRILRYTEFQANSGKNLVPESRVTVLNLLSEQLRNELNYTTFYCGVASHPLFERVSLTSDTMLHVIGKESMSRQNCAKGDPIFKEGVTANYMYFVARGNIRYDRGDVDHNAIAGKSDWISEQALWTEWVHMGDARTIAECQVIAINSKAFVAVVCRDFTVHSILTTYSHNFVGWLNELHDADITEVFNHDLTRASDFLPSAYESEASTKSVPNLASMMASFRRKTRTWSVSSFQSR